ncbi:MAG: class I SAM-dependent methyltransferase [Candidatus Woesearchaeota archaeon]
MLKPVKNDDSFKASKTTNPIAKFFVKKYYSIFDEFLEKIPKGVVAMDFGCGNGYITNYVQQALNAQMTGIDVDEDRLVFAKQYVVNSEIKKHDLYELSSFPENSIDLAVATESLEHLDNPKYVMEQISRITSTYGLFSVPREPVWRLKNIAQGKYLLALGNTPDHKQNWSKRGFTSFVKDYFKQVEVKDAHIWTLVLAKK